jgi:hypothetical protein
MRGIPAPLFNELKSQTARIDTGWLIVRKDGQRFGFTSSDIPFTYGVDVYTPTNGFNPSAIMSKADFSVDNLECQALDNELITEQDLASGVWDSAVVQVFWICRYHPEWGVVPLRGGILGEIIIKDGQWTTQLRSLFQQLQQPFGYFYTLQCGAQLGDARCKVKLAVPAWQANHTYRLGLLTDAGIGDIVQASAAHQTAHPASKNFWYVAQYTTRGPSLATGVAASSVSQGDGIVWLTGDEYVGGSTEATPVTPLTTYDASAERAPTVPGQGLSSNDDLGPNDNTQIAVGPAFDNLQEFVYVGEPVDIFGIKI